MSPNLVAHRGALATALIGGVLVLASCASPTPGNGPSADAGTSTESSDSQSLLDQHGLTGLDARQIIYKLDTQAVADRPPNLLTSVQSANLILTVPRGTDGSATTTTTTTTTSLPMPDDEFYLSVAPYRSQTHECFFHSLTTCLGELSEQAVEVTVTDDETGHTVLADTLTTYDNGFVGLWLPRDLDGTLTIRHDDAEATSPISTGADDLTCLTTMRLA